MIERQIAVAEVIAVLPDFNSIAATVFIHPRKSCLRVRLPRIYHVHLVFTAAYLAQILDSIIVLVTVNVVYLLLRKTAFANRPDGMVQSNMNTSLVYLAVNKQVASLITLSASYRSAISAASQPTALSIVSVVLFHAKQQFLLLRFCQMFLVHKYNS